MEWGHLKKQDRKLQTNEIHKGTWEILFSFIRHFSVSHFGLAFSASSQHA